MLTEAPAFAAIHAAAAPMPLLPPAMKTCFPLRSRRPLVIRALAVVAQKPKLSWRTGCDHVRIELPRDVGRELLGDESMRVVDLQQIASLILGSVKAARMPDLAP